MVAALDDGVARVEKAYIAAGIWDETILIFSTDNVRTHARTTSYR